MPKLAKEMKRKAQEPRIPKLREEWDQATNALVTASEEGKSPRYIKTLRNRQAAAHRAYWEACNQGIESVREGKDPARVASGLGVRIDDMMSLI